MRQTDNRPADILLVEDNPGDVRLTREAMRDSKVQHRLHVVGDGEEALAFLHKQHRFQEVPRPDLVLLDLNLPKKNGRELLAAMKGDEGLKRIPVAILTTSKADEDILASYNLHANCYIVKSVDMDQFIRTVRVIEEFWLNTVQLPPG